MPWHRARRREKKRRRSESSRTDGRTGEPSTNKSGSSFVEKTSNKRGVCLICSPAQNAPHVKPLFPFFWDPFFGDPFFFLFLFFRSPAKLGSLEMQPGAKLQAYLGVTILQPHACTQRFRFRILRRTRSFPGRTSARSLPGGIESIWETPSKERATGSPQSWPQSWTAARWRRQLRFWPRRRPWPRKQHRSAAELADSSLTTGLSN